MAASLGMNSSSLNAAFIHLQYIYIYVCVYIIGWAGPARASTSCSSSELNCRLGSLNPILGPFDKSIGAHLAVISHCAGGMHSIVAFLDSASVPYCDINFCHLSGAAINPVQQIAFYPDRSYGIIWADLWHPFLRRKLCQHYACSSMDITHWIPMYLRNKDGICFRSSTTGAVC